MDELDTNMQFPAEVGSPRYSTKRMENVSCGLAQDFLIYAHNASMDERTHGVHGELIDQFDDLMAPVWCNRVFPFLPVFPSMFEIAALFNLRSYIDRKVHQQTKDQTKMMATTVLRYLLPEKKDYVKRGLPLPNSELVVFLLGIGADPNSGGSSRSIWENTLGFLSTVISIPRDQDGFFDPKSPLRLRYLQIMEFLLAHGADPKCCVNGWSTLSLIEYFLVLEFPVEVKHLLSSIQDRLNGKVSKRQGKKRSRASSPNSKVSRRRSSRLKIRIDIK